VKGVAPAANLVTLSVSQSGTALEFYALTGFDYILAHPELGISAVNNSWGIPATTFDPTAPLNQATKMLHDRGITVVFSAGNSGPGQAPRDHQPEGSSDCSTEGADCRINIQSVAPWTISVAAGSRVTPGPPSSQHLADFSSRGDPQPQKVGSLVVSYQPTITAPGTGIISATGGSLAINTLTCPAVGDIPRCLDRTVAQNVFYTAISGTSMASPHVVGAVAILQSAAKAMLGRLLSPDEVKTLLVQGAQPMPGTDGQYDNCGVPGVPGYESPCGGKAPNTTGKPYAAWQVGAGYLDVAGSLRALDALAHPAPPVVKKKAAKKKAKRCSAAKRKRAKNSARNRKAPKCTKRKTKKRKR
jgi:serine protease AprX